MLAVLVILGGSLSVFADIKPARALIYGALVNATTSTSRGAVVYRVNDTDFAIKPTADMSAVSQISLFFVVSENVQTFSLSIGCLDTRLSQINDGSFSTNTYLYKWENNTASGQVALSGVKRTKTTVDGIGTYTWEYYSSTATTLNCIMVNLPLNITVVDDSNFYNFRVNYLNVNGYAIGEVDVADQVSQINEAIHEDVPLPSAVPSLEDIGGEIVNEGIDLAQSWVQYFTTNFDIAGAMTRVVKPFSDYFLVLPNDGNTAHTTLVVIMLFSLGAVIVVWLINKLKRRQDDA